jgi:hypothetical protein
VPTLPVVEQARERVREPGGIVRWDHHAALGVLHDLADRADVREDHGEATRHRSTMTVGTSSDSDDIAKTSRARSSSATRPMGSQTAARRSRWPAIARRGFVSPNTWTTSAPVRRMRPRSTPTSRRKERSNSARVRGAAQPVQRERSRRDARCPHAREREARLRDVRHGSLDVPAAARKRLDQVRNVVVPAAEDGSVDDRENVHGEPVARVDRTFPGGRPPDGVGECVY